jgi:hypothetical protein
MPIRWRPEAGYLLALASGRLPSQWHGGDRVRLPRRRPREVYRVYTEDEYMNGAELGTAAAGVGQSPPVVEPASKCAGERRLRRVAGMAMLAGAVGAVSGLVVMNDSRVHQGARRRQGSLVTAKRSPRDAISPAGAGSSAAQSWAIGAGRPEPRPEATRSRVARAGRLDGGPDLSRSAHPFARLATRARGSVATVVDHVSRFPSVRAPAVTATAGDTTAIDVSTGSATSRVAVGKPAEFGFER